MRFAHPEEVAKWPEPNLVDPETRGPEIYIIYAIFAFAATVAILLRFYIRVFKRRWLGWDDYTLAFAYLCMLGDMGTVLWGFNRYQWDRHFWDSYHVEYLVPGAKAVMAAKLFWAVAACMIRFSLLVLYYRLLNHIDALQQRTWKWVLHATTFFNVGIFFSYIFTIVFHCRDPAQYFQWPGTGYCINEVYANTALAALNTFAEALMAALPIPVVLQLDMDRAQRNSVLLLLCLGFLVSVVGTVRTYYVYTLFNSNDLTWYAGPHWICSEVEICTAMVCACAPALRSFIGRKFWNEKVAVLTRQPSNRNYTHKSRSSNASSKHSFSDPATEGWVPPQQHYQYDLEGIGIDGYGYTVTISGPQRRHRGVMDCFRRGDESDSRTELPPWRFPRKLEGCDESDTAELRKTPSNQIMETHEITKVVS